MSVYVYCIRENHRHKSSIKGREFENEWLKLEKDGAITVKGSNKTGYAWDGCSPKILKIADMYFGTPEGVLNYTTGRPKTYYASMIHDILYQFGKDIKHLVKRREVDMEFYSILIRDGFKAAGFYCWSVRSFGWIWWGKKSRGSRMVL